MTGPPLKDEDGRLSASDYLRVLMNEHDYLRDEIKSTIASRNAAFLSFAGAAIAAIVKIFPLHTAKLGSTSAHLAALGLLPALWFGICLFQAAAMIRTARAATALRLIDEKAAWLFDHNGTDSMTKAAVALRLHFEGRGLAGSWAEPYVWEGAMHGSGRIWNKERVRNHLVILPAAILSSVAPLILWSEHVAGTRALSTCATLSAIAAYIVIAEAAALWFSGSSAFGRLTTVTEIDRASDRGPRIETRGR